MYQRKPGFKGILQTSRLTQLVTKICLLLTVGILFLSPLAAGKGEAEGVLKVVDRMGREVTFLKPAGRVAAIGPGALRLCTYFQNPDMVIAIEQMDKDDAKGKPYVMANPGYKDLPVIGAGGPNNAPDPEKILASRPDVVFTTYGGDRSGADKLQEKINIPVVALNYGDVRVFDPELYASIRLIGEVIGQEERALAIIDYMESLREDLWQRTRDISDDEKPFVYVGAVNVRGSHGIESTQGKYVLFDVVNAKNVVDELGKVGSLMIDKEQLIYWDPDIIFLDLGGMEPLRQDYQKNAWLYQALSAFRNAEVYGQLPFNYYTTNIDTAIANAYYIGKVLYPERFADIAPETKADEIYEELLGKALYKEMAEDFGGFTKITFD